MLTWDQVWGAVRGTGGLLASKLPSIMSCAWPYASLAQDEMTVRPHHCCRMRPSAVISHMTENVSLSTPAVEQLVTCLWSASSPPREAESQS